jgi:hypothetical protein
VEDTDATTVYQQVVNRDMVLVVAQLENQMSVAIPPLEIFEATRGKPLPHIGRQGILPSVGEDIDVVMSR